MDTIKNIDTCIDKNKLYYELNAIGMEFKKETLGKSAGIIINEACAYFCKYYCKYSDLCDDLECGPLPWCPCGELSL